MDEKRTRHPVDRDQHDRKYDAAATTAGQRSDRHRVDEIGHAEQVPRDRCAARIAFTDKPPVGDEWRQDAGQNVANAGWNGKDPGQLTLEIPNKKPPAENRERGDPNKPGLGKAGNEGAEGPQKKDEI